ncbi:hypothetical protein ACOME3_001349 [Neoechinorhynchus agilis]
MLNNGSGFGEWRTVGEGAEYSGERMFTLGKEENRKHWELDTSGEPETDEIHRIPFEWLSSPGSSQKQLESREGAILAKAEIYIHEYDHGTLAESILAVFKLNKPHYCVCIYNHEFGVFFHPFGLTGAYMCEARQNRFDGFLSLRKRHYIGKTDLPFEDICKIAKTIQEGFGGQYRDSLRFCRAFLVRISMHWTEQDEFSKICKSAMIPLDLDFMETASMS